MEIIKTCVYVVYVSVSVSMSGDNAHKNGANYVEADTRLRPPAGAPCPDQSPSGS